MTAGKKVVIRLRSRSARIWMRRRERGRSQYRDSPIHGAEMGGVVEDEEEPLGHGDSDSEAEGVCARYQIGQSYGR